MDSVFISGKISYCSYKVKDSTAPRAPPIQ